MSLVFYDTETSGLLSAFDQIFQFAAIRVNYDLEVEDERSCVLNLRCRRLPHIVPSPEALRVNRIQPHDLEAGNRSHYEMVREIANTFSSWSPSVFCGYNSIHFDEAFLRQAFYQTLHPIYLTNRSGSYRADVLTMVRAAVTYAPGSVQVPADCCGQPIFKLAEVARLNGIRLSEEEAHDAMNDVRATIEVARLIKANAEEIWNIMMQNALASQVENFLEQNGAFHLTSAFPSGLYSEVACLAGRNPNNKREFAVFCLSYDPGPYLDMTTDELVAAMTQSPRPVRIIRSNAQPILMPLDIRPCDIRGPQLDVEEYERRAQLLRENAAFRERIGAIIAERYADREPSQYVEQRIYGGDFFSRADEEKCARFHLIPWQARISLCAQFEDPRLQELGRRLIFLEQPNLLTAMDRAKMLQWIKQRVMSEDDVPWMTVPKAIIAMGDLSNRASASTDDFLSSLGNYLSEMSAVHH